MTKAFFRWWARNTKRAFQDTDQETMVAHAANMAMHFDGGMTFQLVDAENGKILKVQVPDPNGKNPHGFHPGVPNKEKLYVIPDGEDVMVFITRALVEERIK
jgi:hypothetical protein